MFPFLPLMTCMVEQRGLWVSNKATSLQSIKCLQAAMIKLAILIFTLLIKRLAMTMPD